MRMKNWKNILPVILLAIVMAASFSGCASAADELIASESVLEEEDMTADSHF